MAKVVEPILIGVDISKAELEVSVGEAETQTLPNTLKAIRHWLKQLDGPLELAMEATNSFHLDLACEAHKRGHKVFLLNAYKLNRYRDSIGGRAKTDSSDARLLRRYLKRERDELSPWEPPSKEHRQLQIMLRRRATLVQAKTRIDQSLRDVPGLKASCKALLRHINHVDALIQKKIHAIVRQNSWGEDMARCQAIEGIGPITAAALTMAYHRGHFRSSDAFIAYLGLDVRVRDSGTMRGRRKLTKQGDPELRRLLYLAAMQAKRQPAWSGFYQRCLDRGLAPIQAFNVLGRKLARVAFSLIRNQSAYVPKNA